MKKYNQKADYFIQKMNNGEDKDSLIVDLIETLNDTERETTLLEVTERERTSLLNENLLLKKELGKLKAVRMLMDSAEIYGYQDLFIKAPISTKTELCGHCRKPFDREFWIAEEKCKHCRKFLDNPPFVVMSTKNEKNSPQHQSVSVQVESGQSIDESLGKHGQGTHKPSITDSGDIHSQNKELMDKDYAKDKLNAQVKDGD